MNSLFISSWRTLLKSYIKEKTSYLNVSFFIHKYNSKFLCNTMNVINEITSGVDTYHLIFLFNNACFVGRLIRGEILSQPRSSVLDPLAIIELTLEMEEKEHEDLTKSMRSIYFSGCNYMEEVMAATMSQSAFGIAETSRNHRREWKVEAWDLKGLLLKTEEDNLEDIKNLGCAYLLLNEDNKI
ncbi:MAG: hypothetical protein FHOMOCKG_00028 [Methanophagales virus GBV302]|uniref:Uncharacterized protein n=1 Tax=Methanophagales virus GBV302 TaxID=2999281 RepID=A0A9E8VAW8_9CAUD|nr:MAG: hypothetical protein QIT37_gp028 [Methanophagales virus GBV302]WAE39556.1 MAG: hypothetical protein FHOMOCKG_00028 [Methanophagales virus GBV302]